MAARPVFFFDIDNCLYSKNTKIQNLMGEKIDEYFTTHLSLGADDAFALHTKYYKEYGLAIEGLVRHHKVDALDFNAKVDDALPLEDILKPDQDLQQLLSDIDTSKVKLWLFTNAYVNHGKRVVKLLGVERFFEGITYCDYAAAARDQRLIAKPQTEMFERAMSEAGVASVEDCYFVDDSALNVRAATALGWTAVHFVESETPEVPASRYQIRSLQELRSTFSHFFKS